MLTHKTRTVESRNEGGKRTVELTFQGSDTDLCKSEDSNMFGAMKGMSEEDFEDLCKSEIEERISTSTSSTLLGDLVRGHRLGIERDNANEALAAWKGVASGSKDTNKLALMMKRHYQISNTPDDDRSLGDDKFMEGYEKAMISGDIVAYAKETYVVPIQQKRSVPPGLYYRATRLRGEVDLPLPADCTVVIDISGNIVERGPAFGSFFHETEDGKIGWGKNPNDTNVS